MRVASIVKNGRRYDITADFLAKFEEEKISRDEKGRFSSGGSGKLDADSQEVADFSKKYKFGSIEWQNAMVGRIKRKLKEGAELTSIDHAFVDTQAMHNKRLMDELKSMGFKEGTFNVN